MKIKNYAKINLSLDILGRLPGGYHELEMIMQLVDIADTLDISWEPGGKDLEIYLSGSRADIPYDESNLAWKAAAAMNREAGMKGRLDIYIEKRIPVAAGLAGGSGNAAAVMTALNELWDMGLSCEKLMEMGGNIGKDIPFLISGLPCALAVYDGTVLKEHTPLDCCLVLSKPDVDVSTGWIYGRYDEVGSEVHPDNRALSEAIVQKDLSKTGHNLVNVLEKAAADEYNCIKNTKDKIREVKGILGVSMSGSGPSVFGLAEDKAAADRAARILRKMNRETFSTHTIICGR